MAKSLLLVEDEVEAAEIVRDYLEREHYSVELFDTGVGVVERIRKQPPDLVLLDIMLPGEDGISICRKVRAFSSVPIIMLTAKVDEFDRLMGYELGADDYICKPVNPREILVRVKAVLRRSSSARSDNPRMLNIDEARHLASYGGAKLKLTPTELEVLQLLSSGLGRIFSREEIIDEVYDDRSEASKRSVDTCVKKLRQKISAVADGANPIKSVYGKGYKYEED